MQLLMAKQEEGRNGLEEQCREDMEGPNAEHDDMDELRKDRETSFSTTAWRRSQICDSVNYERNYPGLKRSKKARYE